MKKPTDAMPMRVCMFTECFEPVQNGVSTSVRTLVDELRYRKQHVVIVAPHYADHNDAVPFVLRVPSFQTRFNAGYPVAYPWFPRLKRSLGRFLPDVLHSHSPFFVGNLAARVSARTGTPIVSTYHTLYNHYAHYLFFLPDEAVQSLLEWWIPEYYDRCAFVIAPSKLAEKSVRSYGVRTPVVVIPTAVALPKPAQLTESARLAARKRWSIPPDAPLLLYAGRVAEEKNIKMVIDAFSRIAQAHPTAHLLIVGGGPHEEDCAAYARKSPAGDRIVMAGPVAHDDLPSVYATADLFVFASCTETQGLVIAEARAAGTPCVVVREGGASETVRSDEDGLVVDANVDAFTQAVLALLDNEDLRRRMSEACLRNALDYTPSAMTTRIQDVYRRAVEQRPQTPAASTPFTFRIPGREHRGTTRR